MSRRPSLKVLGAVLLAAACVSLGGCVVGAAVGVAATTVKTGVAVTGAAVGGAANATGAVVRTATGGGSHPQGQD